MSLTEGRWQSDAALLADRIASPSDDESTVVLSSMGRYDETESVLAADESVGCSEECADSDVDPAAGCNECHPTGTRTRMLSGYMYLHVMFRHSAVA